ncbi:MAG: ribosome-associated translation inhibitor RaiA [Acidobacteriota bacterium]
MDVDFTGRQVDVTPGLRQYTHGRLRKLERLLPGDPKLHVILGAEKHRRTAEITATFPDQTLVSVMEAADPRSAIKGALDKLERQVVSRLTRKRTKKRRPKPTSNILLNVFTSNQVDHEERLVIESERLPIKPLTIEEAIESVYAMPSGVVVFRNAESERVNVVYRRPDGKLGLIEPEP